MEPLELADALTREEALRFLASSGARGKLGLFVGARLSKAVLTGESQGVALSWGELLQKTATRMALHIAKSGLGQSWSAGNTWEQRKGEMSEEIVRELRGVATQYNYWSLERLPNSIAGP